MTELVWGDTLADRAWQWLASTGRAASTREIEEGLERTGVEIRGDNPRSVLSSALNRNQHKLRRAGRGMWEALPRSDWADPTSGLTSSELVDHAYSIARALDPARHGFHYEDLLTRLTEQGFVIRGKNRGQSLLKMLAGSPRFHSVQPRRGIWTWV